MGQRIWERLCRAFEGIGLGWSKALWVRFAVAVLLILVVAPILAWALAFNVSDVLLWVTGLILLVYTLETQEMRRQMVLQNEIAIQPLVIAGIHDPPPGGGPPPGDGRGIAFRNIGRGPALFIQAKDVEAADVVDGVRFVAKFAPVDYIEPGGEAVATVDLHAMAEATDRRWIDFVANLDPRYADESYDVTISYEDVTGQKRESVVRMGKDGIRLLRHRKV